MATPARGGDDRPGGCAECGAPLASDQRYCVECGARCGALPAPIAELIGSGHLSRDDATAQVVDAAAAGQLDTMPTPSIAAIAVMALLAFGVVVGEAASPTQQNGAPTRLLIAVSPPPSPAPRTTPTSTSLAPPVAPSTTPAPPAVSTSAAGSAPSTTTKPTKPSTGGGGGSTQTTPSLPPVRHVFLIALADQGEAATFGPGSQAPYLARTLTARGELIENYYAVTAGELANGIALISGQGPTAQSATDCPLYADVSPGTIGAQQQVLGSGCVYPRQTLTLADQLTGEGRTWKAYVEDIGKGAAGQPATCRHPPLGAADPDQAPAPGDAYVTWRNPFVYFHSLIDSPACAENDVGLDQLAHDLNLATSTPSLAYIIPNRCHDGADEPCAPGAPAGLAAADSFLRLVVPEIESSPAYKAGGLIAITFDQAPQSGPAADSSGCCNTAQYPNLPAPAGGTAPPATSTTPATTTPASANPPTSTTATPSTPATTTTTGPASSAVPGGTTTPTSGAGPATPPGGGRVGLLLISSYVKPGTVNTTDDYNHFSLLRSIEDLFGLDHLGYAGATGLLAFDKSVYNAYP